MAAETKAEKALRFISERRLNVEQVVAPDEQTAARIVASCRGDDAEVYRLGFDGRRNEWRCTCPANRQFHRECSHLIALKLVTVRPS